MSAVSTLAGLAEWGAWVTDRLLRLTTNPHSTTSLRQAPTWLTAADGVECTAHHPGSGGVAGIMFVTMSLLDLTIATCTSAKFNLLMVM